MYTVIRFTSNSVTQSVYECIGSEVNSVFPGAYNGLRRAGDGFVCVVSSSDSWADHRAAILEFIRAGRLAISNAQHLNVDVSFDVAIEPEDFSETNALSVYVDPELSKGLTMMAVCLELSVYGGTSGNDG